MSFSPARYQRGGICRAAQGRRADVEARHRGLLEQRSCPARLGAGASRQESRKDAAHSRRPQLRNVDFICTDSVNVRARRFGHGYFAGVDRVLTDIGLVLHYGLPAADRRDLLVPAAEGAANLAFIARTVK